MSCFFIFMAQIVYNFFFLHNGTIIGSLSDEFQTKKFTHVTEICSSVYINIYTVKPHTLRARPQ